MNKIAIVVFIRSVFIAKGWRGYDLMKSSYRLPMASTVLPPIAIQFPTPIILRWYRTIADRMSVLIYQ